MYRQRRPGTYQLLSRYFPHITISKGFPMTTPPAFRCILPSPKRFRGRSPPPQSPGAVAGGRGGDRGEVRTGDFMRRGRHGSPGGGRDSGRMNGRVPDKLPELFSVHRGEVVKVTREDPRSHDLRSPSKVFVFAPDSIVSANRAFAFILRREACKASYAARTIPLGNTVSLLESKG